MRCAEIPGLSASPSSRGARSVFVCLLAAVLQGCAGVTGPVGYPAEWPKPLNRVVDNGCPDLDGLYENRPVGGAPADLESIPTLTEVFTRLGSGSGLTSPRYSGHVWDVPPDAEHVLFRFEGDGLVVRFVATDGSGREIRFRRYHFDIHEKRYDELFHCHAIESGARLRFLASPESGGIAVPGVFLGARGVVVMLIRASDGSLVVQWRTESFGLSTLVIGTHFAFSSRWYRYPFSTPSK